MHPRSQSKNVKGYVLIVTAKLQSGLILKLLGRSMAQTQALSNVVNSTPEPDQD